METEGSLRCWQESAFYSEGVCKISWQLDYGLDNWGVRIPAGARNFYIHHRVQTGSVTHPVSYEMGTRGSFPGGKTARTWSWLLPSI